jgi:enterochelin esterase-like enzyme
MRRFAVKHTERRPHFLGFRLLVLLIILPVIVSACSRDSLELVSMNEIMGLTVAEVISPAIADNLIGEKAQRVISVYLPPGYEETERSFPVLYYYPGFGQTAMYLSRVTSPLDDYFRKHPEDAFIIVGIDVEGVLRHSFGRNSAVTGRWKDFSAREVPQFIEDNFRVATQRGSTGIAGYSAGASAALHIGLSDPKKYGAVWASSPALAPHGDPEAFAASQGAAGRRLHLATLAYETLVKSDGSLDERALEAAEITPEALELIDQRNGEAWAEEVAESLQQANSEPPMIYLGYGSNEWPWLIQGSRDFAGVLEDRNIPLQLDVFEGSHATFYLNRQFEESLIPFFTEAF